MMSMPVEKPKTSRSLMATLAIAFLALSVVVLFIAGSLQIYLYFQTQREIAAGQQQLIAQDAANTVTSFTQEKFSLLEAAVRFGHPAAASPAEQKQVLENLLGLEPAFRHLVLFDIQEQELIKVSRLSLSASRSLTDRVGTLLFAQVKQGDRYVGSVYVDDVTSEPMVIMAVPATNVFGDFQGTLVAEVNLKFMWDLVGRLEIGQTGLAYVVDRQGNLIAFSDIARVLRGEDVTHLREVDEFIHSFAPVDETGANMSSGINGTTIVGTYVPLGTPDWAVVTELPVGEAYREVIRSAVISAGVILAVALLAGLIGVYVARRLAVPLRDLTETAVQIAGGETGLQAAIAGPAEVVSLARAFNSMTAQLRELIGSLEQRVAERTQALARRSVQLETAAQVSEDATSILEPDALVRQVVELVREQFGYYYVGLFLVDESGEWAVLRAGSGEAGQTMLERGHKLQVGGSSMIGRCVAEGQARIALDVGEEAVRFANPLLPHTRSEMALPLVVRGQAIGALSVQSEREAAFSEEDASILQTMASQVANAIQNARQFELLNRARAETSKRVQELDSLSDIGQKMAESPSMEELLPWVAERIPAAMQYPSLCVVAVEYEAQIYGMPEAKTLPWQMVRSLEVGSDAANRIYVAYTERQGFLNEESALLGDIARRLSNYIEGRLLFRETEVRAEELAVLNELGQALTASMDVEEVMNEAYRGASRLMDTTNFFIGLYDPEKNEINIPLEIAGPEIPRLTVIPASQGISGYVIRNRTSVLIKEDDVEWRAERGVGPMGDRARSWLAVPLMVGEQVLGVMTVRSYITPNLYDEHDLDLLTAIANQTAIALQNAYLFRQSQQALAEAEIARQDTQGALAEAEAVHRRYLRQEWQTFLSGPFAARFRGFQDSAEGAVPLSEVQEADTQQTTALPSSTGGEREDGRQLSVPVRLRGQTIGFIDLAREDEREWTEGDQALAESFAEQLALAIENARLFEQTQERARRERTIREITDKVRRAADMDTILQTTVRELGRVLGTSHAAVRLGTGAGSDSSSVGENRSTEAEER
jgi:GAF domain-containing protein/HAMP domain-containing protein